MDTYNVTHSGQHKFKLICCYCGDKADGTMVAVGDRMAHAECVIRKLNELFNDALSMAKHVECDPYRPAPGEEPY